MRFDQVPSLEGACVSAETEVGRETEDVHVKPVARLVPAHSKRTRPLRPQRCPLWAASLAATHPSCSPASLIEAAPPPHPPHHVCLVIPVTLRSAARLMPRATTHPLRLCSVQRRCCAVKLCPGLVVHHGCGSAAAAKAATASGGAGTLVPRRFAGPRAPGRRAGSAEEQLCVRRDR
jgi:hypothetical protein